MFNVENILRKKYRFPSARGALSLEQLWDVPLRSKNGFNLDEVARSLHMAIESHGDVSFVDTQEENHEVRMLTECFEAVKYVIKTKLTEENARLKAAEKKDEALKSLSVEELQARLGELE